MLVALTGGIASGKSAVAGCFKRQAVPVFDADMIARELVQPGMPAFSEIAAVFGAKMLTASGELDRQRMRDLIFSVPDQRRKLEAIVHPRVRAALREEIEHCAAEYCVLAIPLLVEVRNDYDFVDRVLVIDASPAIQQQRLILRDGCSPETAAAMIAVQASREERLAIADDVIDNDGSIRGARSMIERLHALYRGSPAFTKRV